MHTEIRAIVACLFVLAVAACGGNRGAGSDDQVVQQNVEAYQRALIARRVTGGSVAGVFRGGDTVAYSIVNSGLAGDAPISSKATP